VTSERLEIPVPGSVLIGDRVRGDGPVVVLLHAGVCDRRSWREVAERLAADHHDVVAYDRRGFGEVPPPDRPFRHADDLLVVLDVVSPNAPAWLVGSSMGGEVAVDAALAAPERVAGLVLLAPRVGGEPEPDEAIVVAATNGLAEAIDDAWTSGDEAACNRHEIRLWLDGPAGPEGRVRGPAREMAFEMNRIVIANGESEFDGAGGQDAARRLGEIAVPVVVACGDLDVSLKMEAGAALARALPAGEYEVLPGRAHLPYLEAPDEVAALIGAVVKRPRAGLEP
jgi:pimeloyl-ACP methyl ester carboxylesterase